MLRQLDIPFVVVETGHTMEQYPSHLEAGEIAVYLAEHKSDSCPEPIGSNQILLTADTVVWHLGRELGKPRGEEEAIAMLRSLSGSTHQVFTGVCLRSLNTRHSFCSSTRVTFADLELAEIEYYVKSFRPFDKAGAYGIQEWIGHIAVERIEGSYFNVIGLPVQKVYRELKKFVTGMESPGTDQSGTNQSGRYHSGTDKQSGP